MTRGALLGTMIAAALSVPAAYAASPGAVSADHPVASAARAELLIAIPSAPSSPFTISAMPWNIKISGLRDDVRRQVEAEFAQVFSTVDVDEYPFAEHHVFAINTALEHQACTQHQRFLVESSGEITNTAPGSTAEYSVGETLLIRTL